MFFVNMGYYIYLFLFYYFSALFSFEFINPFYATGLFLYLLKT